MQTHQIRYFIKVAQTGSFTAAAEECNVSQPTLSQQVRKLEENLGSPLFHRLKSKVILTDVGEQFYYRATAILEEMEAARQDVYEMQGLIRGKLRLGVIPTIAPYLLPQLVRCYTDKHPGVELEIQEDLTPNLLRDLLNAQIDIALLSLPVKEDHFEVQKLFSDELLITLPAKHTLGHLNRLSLDDLSEESFILMREGHCLGDQTMHFCEVAQVNPRIAIRSSQIETIHTLIQIGMGISLTPSMAVDPRKESQKNLLFRSMAPVPLQREIALVWRRNATLSAATRAFKKISEKEFEDKGNPTK